MSIRITVDQSRCKSCELCTTVCPKHLVTIDMDTTTDKGYNPACVKDMEACVGCASCAKICPDSAICIERI